ncbi:MAG TPA: hypothetical protein VK973_09215 [Arenicellales bacterium]|nr:hypothetical protein [Arenicellales bacterium]
MSNINDMIKRHLSRHFIVAVAIFVGLFAQFQAVLACELMGGKVQSVCCCDEPGDMSKGCAMGGGCQDQAPGSATAMDCCAVSYQEAPSAKAAPPGVANIQVLLLDAPQPPPIPASFHVPEFPPVDYAPRYTRFVPPWVAGTYTYLLTNRFRI